MTEAKSHNMRSTIVNPRLWLRQIQLLGILTGLSIGQGFAADFCIDTSSELRQALITASTNGENDRLMIVQGRYIGPFSYSSRESSSLEILGGYSIGCRTRTIEPSNTRLESDGISPALTLSAAVMSNQSKLSGFTLVGGSATIDQGGTYLVENFEIIDGSGNPIGLGLYDPAVGIFYLRNSIDNGAADITFRYGGMNSGRMPIAGDWNGDGSDTAGLYDARSGIFYLRNSNNNGVADVAFRYGGANSGRTPIIGDWNGDGSDTIGLYDARTGIFYLRNSNNNGVADITFRYGGSNSVRTPIVGDWNGDGTDTVGLYDARSGIFFLRNSNSNGIADITFRYGGANSIRTPIVGNWNNDIRDTIGLYDAQAGLFFLRNSNDNGIADITVRYGGTNSSRKPLVGSWVRVTQ
ncbi:hypothetical protein U5801_22390 [Lamprobacter modestohalophilus]|uniref:RICIN domain-containing protein n=1 Tax=Lamprobacter modestohalophilus TaxID=1064514 RepID=UPI002ADEBBF9|nr:hypothetical protein [Lamprobacter modestohalophilus]MEA1052534.1 hypothetical protein [Lamprobacter modestohalophilus]